MTMELPSIEDILDAESARAFLTRAKIARLNAETTGQLIDNRTAMALADTSDIAAERERKTARWEGVANSRVREYRFTSQVDSNTVDLAIDTLSRWHRIDSADGDFTTPYKFIICSPGGNVIPGMSLHSHLSALANVRPVITVASGMCASMGTVIHQAGSLRVIEPGCSYLIHDVSGESFGSLGNMQDTMDWLNKLNSMLHQALAAKAKISFAEVAELGKRRDGWFVPEEIIAYGLADIIGYAFDVEPLNFTPVAKPAVERKPRTPKAVPAPSPARKPRTKKAAP